VGVYEDFTLAVVDIRPARPKEIPVVTATWPRRLNLISQQLKIGIEIRLTIQ
jgi:hypothetical protein